MWIKIHDKLLDWEWAGCPETLALWIHILLRANYEDRRWQGILIQRGSFITSVGELVKNTGLSTQQVRTSLKRLTLTNEILVEATNRYTKITICKYESYQLNEDAANNQDFDSVNNRITNEQQTNNKRITTTAESTEAIYKENISKDISKKVSELEGDAKMATCSKSKPDLSFVDERLLPIFKEFLSMRSKKGKSLKTQKGIKDRYDTLIRLSGGNIALAKEIAEQTLKNEWMDFYELKPPAQAQTAKQTDVYTNDKYWN